MKSEAHTTLWLVWDLVWEHFTSGEGTTGGQLGIFEGRGPIHEKRHKKTF